MKLKEIIKKDLEEKISEIITLFTNINGLISINQNKIVKLKKFLSIVKNNQFVEVLPNDLAEEFIQYVNNSKISLEEKYSILFEYIKTYKEKELELTIEQQRLADQQRLAEEMAEKERKQEEENKPLVLTLEEENLFSIMEEISQKYSRESNSNEEQISKLSLEEINNNRNTYISKERNKLNKEYISSIINRLLSLANDENKNKIISIFKFIQSTYMMEEFNQKRETKETLKKEFLLVKDLISALLKNGIQINNEIKQKILNILAKGYKYESLKSLSESNLEEASKLLEQLGISKEEVLFYEQFNLLQRRSKDDIQEIDNYFMEQNQEGLEVVKTAIEELNDIANRVKDIMSNISNKRDIQDERADGENFEEQNNSIMDETLVFIYKKNDADTFQIEESLEKLEEQDYDNDLRNIFLFLTAIKKQEVGRVEKIDYAHRLAPVYTVTKSGDISDPYKLVNEKTGKEYELLRIKDKCSRQLRLPAIRIDVPDENLRKLGLEPNKVAYIILDAVEININDEKKSYSKIRRKVKNDTNGILKFITLLENPNTSEEILKTMYDESMSFMEKYVVDKKGRKF